MAPIGIVLNQTMELKIEAVDIDTLITDPDQVRVHNDRNRDAVRGRVDGKGDF